MSISKTHLESELSNLKNSTIEMARLAKKQIVKSVEALFKFDKNLAREVRVKEKRLNALELKIDRECENILALYNPVATDLRFVFSTLRINSNIERIGDNAEGLSKVVLNAKSEFDKDLLKKVGVKEMADTCIEMIDMICESFQNEDSDVARKMFEMDVILNERNDAVSEIIVDYLQKETSKEEALNALAILHVVRKLERVGDCVTNIAEEIIFHLEAEVLKHHNLLKKITE
ncbi:MAG: phosphate transport system protein [Sphingobacteriales bacterium]|jgi:phosphate transport system protein